MTEEHPSSVADGAAALVLGLDSHGLAIARALAESGACVYAVEKDLSLPGAASRYPKRVFRVPGYGATDLLPALREIRRQLSQHAQVSLLAVNDRQVDVIARHRDTVAADYRVAWATRAETVLRLLSKSELKAVCERQRLRYPRSVVFEKAGDGSLAAEFEFPLILKPVQPLSSFKTLIARDTGELAQHLRRQAHDLPILGQEYIEGDDTSIHFGALFLDHGRVLGRLVGRKLASHPPARGQTLVAETVDEPEVIALTEQFFAGMELSGPVSLELKRDPAGRFWVIEPTVGRTDFWAQLCIGAGFNQPLMEHQLAIGGQPQPPAGIVQAIWYDTERDPLAYGRLCWRDRSLQPTRKRQTFPYWGHGDPLPFGRSTWRAAAARLSRAFRSPVQPTSPSGGVR